MDGRDQPDRHRACHNGRRVSRALDGRRLTERGGPPWTCSLGAAMPGLEISKIPEGELLQTRGW